MSDATPPDKPVKMKRVRGGKARAKALKARLDAHGPSPAVTHEKLTAGVGGLSVVINERTLAGLAAIHCTYEEMGAILGVSEDTIRTNPANVAIVEKERMAGRMGLRQAQMKSALNGNATMLIWLGKIILGQKPPEEDGKAGSFNGDEDGLGDSLVIVRAADSTLPTSDGLDIARNG